MGVKMPSLPPPPSVTLFHHVSRSAEPHEHRETIPGDQYRLAVALCSGCARVVYNGHLLHDGRVAPGMMRLVAPGDDVRAATLSRWESVVLTIPGPSLQATFAAWGYRHVPGNLAYVDALLRPDRGAEQIGRALLTAGDLDPVYAALYIHGLTEALIAILLNAHRSGTGSPALPGLTPAQVRRAEEFADAAIGGGLDLDGWSASLGMAPAEFTRRFRRATGLAPYAWFMRRRVERAKDLLADPRRSVAEVALDVGFSSQSHFTEAFRRLTGLPPARWRAAVGS